MKVRLMALMFGFSLIVGLPLVASAGPVAGGGDIDLDGVEDALDNCFQVANPDQADSNHDGCGDACTAPISCDGNGDTVVGVPDLAVFVQQFGTCTSNCSADWTGDDIVGVPDISVFVQEFGNQVGPSRISTTQCNRALCQCTPQ